MLIMLKGTIIVHCEFLPENKQKHIIIQTTNQFLQSPYDCTNELISAYCKNIAKILTMIITPSCSSNKTINATSWLYIDQI